MRAHARRGSATVDYLAAVAAVGLLLLALVAVREHRPQRRPPVNPVAHIGALVRLAPVPRPPLAEPTVPRPPRPRPPRHPPPPRVTVLSPSWAIGW
jgi:hypothetical protein